MTELLAEIPNDIYGIIEDLFEVVPFELSMPNLVVRAPNYELLPVAGKVVEKLAGKPTLQAAIWLYAEDLDGSHKISQTIMSEEGSFLHGMMHRREGDFSNAKYWFSNAGSLPRQLGLDPFSLTDEVARHPRGNPIQLVEAQRREWLTVFVRCARQAE